MMIQIDELDGRLTELGGCFAGLLRVTGQLVEIVKERWTV